MGTRCLEAFMIPAVALAVPTVTCTNTAAGRPLVIA